MKSDINIIKSHKAYQYAQDVVNDKVISGKYIKIACKKFLDDVHNPDECKYFLNTDDLVKITNLTKLINMATGLKVGTPAHDA